MSFRFEDLVVWHGSNTFASKVYRFTNSLPQSEQFGLSDQLRRAANSIPVNIAEGSGSASNKDFANFLNIAIRSIFEVVSLLFRCEQESYLSRAQRVRFYKEAELLVKQIQAFRTKLIKR